jgi:inorganic pyrophosphatase
MHVTSPLLLTLPTYDDKGHVNAVVEAPKGSLAKLKYDTNFGIFTISRALPVGISYPYDWGFIPTTEGPDGDPLDVLILHEGSTFPGIVIPCHPLGLIKMDEEDKKGRRRRNDRIIVTPIWQDCLGDLQGSSDVSKAMRKEIEQFFLNTVFFSSKNARVLGWKGGKKAASAIEAGRIAYKAKQKN